MFLHNLLNVQIVNKMGLKKQKNNVSGEWSAGGA
jgi:hypothetical protein